MSLLAQAASRRCRPSVVTRCRNYSAPADGSIPASKKRFIPDSGFYPKGFLLGSAHAGVKASNTTKDDVAIIASEHLCQAAGFFTKNTFRAAPVTVSKGIIDENRGHNIRGVVINSGCANAVTGTQGLDDAIAMSAAVDRCFSDKAEAMITNDDGSAGRKTLVMSTGVIGQNLPIKKILDVLPPIKASLSSGHDTWMSVAKAIMTTDTFPKLVSRKFTLPSHPETEYSIAGMSKGAGMIHPNLGTLLSIICTDAPILHSVLRASGKDGLRQSFNSISIDGDTSTNDTVFVFANGAAAPSSAKTVGGTNSKDGQAFQKELHTIMQDLAKLVVRDGEGATKFITIKVNGAPNSKYAHTVAQKIGTSPLVKTAMYGKDANWGRILCAIGNVLPAVNPTATSVSFGIPEGVQGGTLPPGEAVEGAAQTRRLMLVHRGQPVGMDEALAAKVLDEEDITIYVDLDDGETKTHEDATIHSYWTCDFSHEYVTINGDYRT